MSQRNWYLRTTLATAVTAALMTAVAQVAGAGAVPASAANGAATPGTLISPSLPVPSPTLPVSPPPVNRSPSVAPPPVPGPQPPIPVPGGGGPAAGSGGAARPGAGGAAGSARLPVSVGTAAAIIAANPAADLYPQPPVDPITTPQAAQVAALQAVEHRIQYLDNILVRTRADLGTAERGSDPVSQLITAFTGSTAGSAAVPANSAVAAAAADTPAGKVLALSAAVDSAQAELDRRQSEAAVLQQQVTSRVQPVLSRPAPAATGYLGGKLLRPVSGPITSPFGVRFDPYYHVWQLHAGADIGAATGTPIVAAAGGRVSQAGWFGGYGNYTCIDHGVVDGQRLSTCYGHQSRILVSPGQLVRAGQVIGLVGSTGAATGPHLHFEVRLGGRPVDPLPWI